jgi:hypothetical protein
MRVWVEVGLVVLPQGILEEVLTRRVALLVVTLTPAIFLSGRGMSHQSWPRVRKVIVSNYD